MDANETETGTTYRYREFGKYLVCVDQSLAGVCRSLLFGYHDNKLDSLGVSKQVVRNAVKVVAKAKIRSKASNQYHRLPAFGHLGMRVHRGSKLFDFENSTVTKFFAADVSTDEALAEIAACKEASAVSAAPQFLDADPNLTWFCEEFVRGAHGTDVVLPDSSDYFRYYEDAERCLIDLIGCTPPRIANAMDHVTHLADTAYQDRWLNAGISRPDVDRIGGYMEQLQCWLALHLATQDLQLVRTHGDFSLVNAILTDDGLRFIDWEGIGPGSLYSDIYNFMFAERYYSRTSADFVSEVSMLLERFRATVLERMPMLSDAANMEHQIARRLYYLERVRHMLDRDVTPNLHRVIQKSIAMFDEFDVTVGDALP